MLYGFGLSFCASLLVRLLFLFLKRKTATVSYIGPYKSIIIYRIEPGAIVVVSRSG